MNTRKAMAGSLLGIGERYAVLKDGELMERLFRNKKRKRTGSYRKQQTGVQSGNLLMLPFLRSSPLLYLMAQGDEGSTTTLVSTIGACILDRSEK